VLDALVEYAAVLACEGQASRARDLLGLAAAHPAVSRTTRQRAAWLLDALPPAETATPAPPTDPARALEEQVASLLAQPAPARF
jgi:hypothetical protein